MVYLAIFLMCWAFIMFGLMDKLAHHYSSIEIGFIKNNPSFWNKEISWKNKYDESGVDEKFKGSTTYFVFLTDGWHLIQWMAYNFICASFTLLMCQSIWDFIVTFVILRILFTTFKAITMNSL